MMGSNDQPQKPFFYSFNLDEAVPQDHLLRSIDRFLDLTDLREHLAPYYSHTGRPSVDPELMIRMLIIGSITEEHLVLTGLTVAASVPINQGMSDSWYSPATNGQGFFIIVWPQIGQIFLSWFTYNTERPPANVTAQLGEPGHRWLTAQGNYSDNTAMLDVFVSKGGMFDSGSPTPATTRDGTMILEFSDCNSATITYDIPSVDRQGEVKIQRVALDNLALCEVLAEQQTQ